MEYMLFFHRVLELRQAFVPTHKSYLEVLFSIVIIFIPHIKVNEAVLHTLILCIFLIVSSVSTCGSFLNILIYNSESFIKWEKKEQKTHNSQHKDFWKMQNPFE